MINNIEITDVIIFPVKKKLSNDSCIAFARIIINDSFIISGIKIYKGKAGEFMKFPQEYNKKIGRGYDICFPITAELRNYINNEVLKQFDIVKGEFNHV